MMRKFNLDFHNTITFERGPSKNAGGGGNYNSNANALKNFLREPANLVRERYMQAGILSPKYQRGFIPQNREQPPWRNVGAATKEPLQTTRDVSYRKDLSA